MNPDPSKTVQTPANLRKHMETRAFAPGLIGLAVRAFDALILIVTGFLAYHLRFDLPALKESYLPVLILVTLIFLYGGETRKIYAFWRLANLFSSLRQTLLSLVLTALLMMALAFMAKQGEDFSRLWAGFWFASASVLLAGSRWFWFRLVTHEKTRKKIAKNIALVGETSQVLALYRHFQRQPHPDTCIIGLFTDRQAVLEPPEPSLIQGSCFDVLSAARFTPIDQIILAVAWDQTATIKDHLDTLRTLPVEVLLCPPLHDELLNRPLIHLSGAPMITVMKRPMSDEAMLAKRLFDASFSAGILLAALPLLLAVAIAIKLNSPGPVLFRQTRYGIGNHPFKLYKFRSMFHGQPPERRIQQATKDDPRVTPVGRWLRRLSIDELPQLLNVLKGDMSLVGPRPHADQHNDKFAILIDDYLNRHKVKPGITGWAQINGHRGETETIEKMEARVAHDLWYVDNWSLWLDLKILFLTAFRLVDRNAY